MCLIAVAHRVSEALPLVIAANRDEDHQRPTLDAHWWTDASGVVGGRDLLQGGAWLAMTRGGKFAAVTNLRGSQPRPRSRGFLVRDFVTTDATPLEYAREVVREANEYSGFHLVAGSVGGEAVHVTGSFQSELAPGVYAITNAPVGEVWPKAKTATERMEAALRLTDRAALIEELMQFLSAPLGSGAPDSEIFINGDRYGTRSSTVIVASEEEIVFVEQSFGPDGQRLGDRTSFRFAR